MEGSEIQPTQDPDPQGLDEIDEILDGFLSDSIELEALRAELETLRAELENLRATPAGQVAIQADVTAKIPPKLKSKGCLTLGVRVCGCCCILVALAVFFATGFGFGVYVTYNVCMEEMVGRVTPLETSQASVPEAWLPVGMVPAFLGDAVPDSPLKPTAPIMGRLLEVGLSRRRGRQVGTLTSKAASVFFPKKPWKSSVPATRAFTPGGNSTHNLTRATSAPFMLNGTETPAPFMSQGTFLMPLLATSFSALMVMAFMPAISRGTPDFELLQPSFELLQPAHQPPSRGRHASAVQAAHMAWSAITDIAHFLWWVANL